MQNPLRRSISILELSLENALGFVRYPPREEVFIRLQVPTKI